MSSVLPLLRSLFEKDVRLDEINAELAHLPVHIAEIEKKLETHKNELQAQKDALEAHDKERRALESSVALLEEKAKKLEEQLAGATTNDQYRAFRSEIAFVRKEIKKAEDRVLDLMELDEVAREKASAAEKALAEEEQVVAKEVEETRARFKGDEDALVQVTAERKEIADQLKAGALRLYDGARRKRNKQAVAPLNGEQCSSCHMRIRPQLVQQLRKPEPELVACEFCGCILYIPEAEAPAEDPAGDAGVA